MNVEIWRTGKYQFNTKVEDWSEMYKDPQNILLVESQEELDFFWAMQLVYGTEIDIQTYDPLVEMYRYRMRTNGYVYTTWDPADRNRI